MDIRAKERKPSEIPLKQTKTFIHFLPLIPFLGCGSLKPITASWKERLGTPWKGQHSNTGPTQKDRQLFMLTFTTTTNLQPPVNLTCFSLDCGRKIENPEKTQGRTRKLHRVDLNPGCKV